MSEIKRYRYNNESSCEFADALSRAIFSRTAVRHPVHLRPPLGNLGMFMDYGMDFEKVCAEAGCSTDQGREIAGFVLEYIHRAAYCEWDYGMGGLWPTYLKFGPKAAYHLMGFLAHTAEGWGESGQDVVETVNYNWPQDSKDELKTYIPDFTEWENLKSQRRKDDEQARRAAGEPVF